MVPALWLEDFRSGDSEGVTRAQVPAPFVYNHPEPQYENRTRRSTRHTCTSVTHGASMCVGAHVTLYTHPRLRATFEQTCISARAHVRASVRALRHPTPHKGAHTRHSPGTHVSPRYLRTGSGERAHVRGSVRALACITPQSVRREHEYCSLSTNPGGAHSPRTHVHLGGVHGPRTHVHPAPT